MVNFPSIIGSKSLFVKKKESERFIINNEISFFNKKMTINCITFTLFYCTVNSYALVVKIMFINVMLV